MGENIGSLTFGMNINPSTTVVKRIIKPPNTAASLFKNLFSATELIINAVIMIVDKYMITVKYLESLRTLIVTFLVRKARMTATI